MTMAEVTMVRIYCTESDGKLDQILALLHDDAKLAGVTVNRAMSGFGPSGQWHGSDWLDMSLDLPLSIEFFDRPDRVTGVLERLNKIVEPGHLVCWPAQANLED